jgi:hypothetical protein
VRQNQHANALGNADKRNTDFVNMLPPGVIVIGNKNDISAVQVSECSGFHFFAPPALQVAGTFHMTSASTLRSPSTTKIVWPCATASSTWGSR